MCSVANKDADSRRRTAFLALMTALFGVGCIFFEYLAMPFAAAFYAALVYHEKSGKRVFTFLIPSLIFVLNFILNAYFPKGDFSSLKGSLSLSGVVYVIVGLIIYFSFKHLKSKGEAAFYATVLTVASYAVSVLFLAFSSLKSFDTAAIEQYFMGIITPIKDEFVDIVTSIASTNKLGEQFFYFNSYEAEELFREVIFLTIPTFIIFAFLSVGIAFKLFVYLTRSYYGESRELCTWRFRTTTPVAVFYVIISIISFFVSPDGGVFSIVISTLYLVFLAVYAYIGYNFLVAVIAHKLNRPLANLIVLGSIFLFSSFAVQLISYFGAYSTITSNKILNQSKK